MIVKISRTYDHLDAVALLRKALFKAYRMPFNWFDHVIWLKNARTMNCWLAIEENNIIGSIETVDIEYPPGPEKNKGLRSVFIYSLYVAPIYRGQGIGQNLLNAVKDYANDLKLDSIIVIKGKQSRSLYPKNGFVPVHRGIIAKIIMIFTMLFVNRGLLYLPLNEKS